MSNIKNKIKENQLLVEIIYLYWLIKNWLILYKYIL